MKLAVIGRWRCSFENVSPPPPHFMEHVTILVAVVSIISKVLAKDGKWKPGGMEQWKQWNENKNGTWRVMFSIAVSGFQSSNVSWLTFLKIIEQKVVLFK